MFQQLPNRAGTVTPEQQKSHCTRGTDAMAQQKSTVSILRHAARVVAYLLASLVLVAVVASCAATAPLQCHAKPLPEECNDAI